MERECEKKFAERIGYSFRDPRLLREALTHKSYSYEQAAHPPQYSERLEFLGDAVLDLVVSDLLFRDYPDLPEGELTRIRAEVVREAALARIGRDLGIGDCLFLGRGEEKSGGRQKESLIADAVEALLGAVFRDGGLEAVSALIESRFQAEISRAAGRKSGIDHKSRLQELLQGRFGCAPEYAMIASEGPDHERLYTVEVRFDGKAVGSGSGRSKKAAEQLAAREALASLEG